MPRRARSPAENRRAKLAGIRPVRMPACQAAARRLRASGGRRLQVTYCANLQDWSSLGKFSCGIRESHASRPPRGTMTFTRRSCISSAKGTGKGTVLAVSRFSEPSGCAWAQWANSLWKPGTVTNPPAVGAPSESARRPCTPKKPGEDQGFWSQCNQLRLVRHSGCSTTVPSSPPVGLRSAWSRVGRITPNRSTDTTRRPPGISASSPSKRSPRHSASKMWFTAGLTRLCQDFTSAQGSSGSKKFLQPAGQASPSQVLGSPLFSPGWPPKRLGLSQSSLTVASTCASSRTPLTTTKPCSWKCLS
mmetsp:Transcript_48330/g.134356  ORF Transcript_48330/g.134356 Transcript_48330/m.134356 type:complete len:304 (+) Transcript_48330:340-1251(+)